MRTRPTTRRAAVRRARLLHGVPRLPAAVADLHSLKSPQELASITPSILPQHPNCANFTEALERAGPGPLDAEQPAIVGGVDRPGADRDRAAGRVRAGPVPQQAPAGHDGWILVSQVFPVILIMIPLFLILRPLHLTNTTPVV